MEKLTELCKQIYETGIWPEDFTKVAMIPIPKKDKCSGMCGLQNH